MVFVSGVFGGEYILRIRRCWVRREIKTADAVSLFLCVLAGGGNTFAG